MSSLLLFEPAFVGGVDVPRLLVQWIVRGALFALIAIGFTLIFGVGGVLNLAHGATITIGGFTAWYATGFADNIAVGLVVGMAAGGLFSLALYQGMIRHVHSDPIRVMILSLVTAVLIEEIAQDLITTQSLGLRNLVPGSVSIAGSRVELNLLVVFLLSWVFIGALMLFITRTRTGKAIIAVSMSGKGAALAGIDANRIQLYTWLVAGLLAGVAGVFLASFQNASWQMGREPLVLSFSIVILGGLGSIKGSVIGAYIISFMEVLTVNAIDTRMSGLAGLLVLIVVLLVKPEGLYGREFAE